MPGELILDLTICSSHLAGVGAASSLCPASLLFALCSFLGWGSIIRMYLCSQLHTHWHTRAHRLPLCEHWKPILLQWSEAFTSGCVNTESNKPVRAAKWACWSGRRRLLKHSALDMENKACHQFWGHAHVNFPTSLLHYATFYGHGLYSLGAHLHWRRAVHQSSLVCKDPDSFDWRLFAPFANNRFLE